MNKTIACIVGTRPQFIKHAALQGVLSSRFNLCLIHTGQHQNTDLSHQIFDNLEIPPPDYKLSLPEGICREERIQLMRDGLSSILEFLLPDSVVLYGDTDSTLAGALSAEKLGLPCIHIEAGERSRNPEMPEEHNRVLTDRSSRLLCCASQTAFNQLNSEGMGEKAHFTGDLMKDLLLKTEHILQEAPVIGEYYFATIHRNYTRENINMLQKLLHALNTLRSPVYFSLHPSTRSSLEIAGISLYHHRSINILNPLSYAECLRYQKFSKAILTDSGGIQKEAYWLKKPCITLRKETEWSETLVNKHNQLFYGDGELEKLLIENPAPFDPNLYGDGHAAESITRLIEAFT
jgi:UDP-GlcNAc3NAcA epimerase